MQEKICHEAEKAFEIKSCLKIILKEGESGLASVGKLFEAELHGIITIGDYKERAAMWWAISKDCWKEGEDRTVYVGIKDPRRIPTFAEWIGNGVEDVMA